MPFDATNPVAVIQGHLNAPPPLVSRLRPGLPVALDAVLAKAMAKHAAERFDSCGEFAAAAWQALTAPAAPWPPTGPDRSPPQTDAAIQQRPARAYLGPVRRSRWHASVGGWLGLLLVLGLIGVVVAVVRSGTESSSSTEPTTTVRPQHAASTAPPTTRRPATTVAATTDRATIGARAAELSAAFPDMLPETSAQRLVHSGTGYNKAGCFAHAPDSPTTRDHDDPDFGPWLVMWSCFGGPNKASFDFYLYGSPAEAQSVLDALPPNDRAAATGNSGHSYTNYTLRDSRNLRPRMVTAFSDQGRATMLMYSAGFIATDAEFLDWWKSAPLN